MPAKIRWGIVAAMQICAISAIIQGDIVGGLVVVIGLPAVTGAMEARQMWPFKDKPETTKGSKLS